jgi:hypothetical protein
MSWKVVGLWMVFEAMALAAPQPPNTNEVATAVRNARADLMSADEERAATAAMRLKGMKGPGTTDALLDALALGVPPNVARAALDALAEHHEKETVDTLVRYAQHRNPEVRAKALYALGFLDDARARAAILRGLGDAELDVRDAAGRAAVVRKELSAVKPLLVLLKKGDGPAVAALAAIANADVARQVAELAGEAPDALVAQCLGAMLLRKDLGPEQAYVEIVRTLGRIPGNDAVVALTTFIGAVPETPPRPSRKEAQTIYEHKLSGGGN